MRRDPEAVTRRELLFGIEIGKTKGMLGYEFAAMCNCDDAPGLLCRRDLEFKPIWNVIDGRSEPWLHVLDLQAKQN